jgi:predicted glycosyltransferase
MRILIDIGHPAHVHLFRNFYFEMKGRNHDLFVTVKEIPAAERLLQVYGIPFKSIGSKTDSIAGKALNQVLYDWRMFKYVRKNKIEIGIGSSITQAHVSGVSKMRCLLFDDDDDEVQPLFVKYGHPFADCILSPDALRGKRKQQDTVYYDGYHELAYLHPNRFSPDFEVCSELGLKPGEPFFIMRFNAFKAHHDIGSKGLSREQKLKLIEILSSEGRIFITSENNPEPELAGYQLNISPDRIHSLLYYATLFLGDSQTMTSEAAVLGTPAIRCNSFAGRLSVIEEEEHKYGLTYSFNPGNFNMLLEKVRELIILPGLKEEWQRRRQRMLADKIDVTAFMIWFTENYPDSARIIHEDPLYQEKFR